MVTSLSVALAAVLAASTCAIVHACLGAPYLYVTDHGSSSPGGPQNNIFKYSRDGCALGQVTKSPFSELRSMLVLDDGSMLLANGNKDNSEVYLLSQCLEGTGMRSVLASFLNASSNPGLQHPYGLAHSSNGSVFVTNQDSNAVLRFAGYHETAAAGTPLPAPGQASYPASFAQFDPNSDGVRGVAVGFSGSEELVFVASEDKQAVVIFDMNGRVTASLPVEQPVGVHIDASATYLYVSNAGKQSGVLQFDLQTLQLLQTFTHDSLSHPAGVTDDGSVLYVVSQNHNKIRTFDLSTGKYIGTLFEGLDAPEQIAMVPC